MDAVTCLALGLAHEICCLSNNCCHFTTTISTTAVAMATTFIRHGERLETMLEKLDLPVPEVPP